MTKTIEKYNIPHFGEVKLMKSEHPLEYFAYNKNLGDFAIRSNSLEELRENIYQELHLSLNETIKERKKQFHEALDIRSKYLDSKSNEGAKGNGNWLERIAQDTGNE